MVDGFFTAMPPNPDIDRQAPGAEQAQWQQHTNERRRKLEITHIAIGKALVLRQIAATPPSLRQTNAPDDLPN